jgi:hypothetical protein
VQAGLERVKANIGSMVKKGRMTQEQGAAVVARVKGCLDFNDFPRCHMVRKHRVCVSCAKGGSVHQAPHGPWARR